MSAKPTSQKQVIGQDAIVFTLREIAQITAARSYSVPCAFIVEISVWNKLTGETLDTFAADPIDVLFKPKHADSKSTEHTIWCGMIARCESPANHAYRDYGGRGITVCDRWRHSYEAFLTDMGRRPPELSLDRIDNDGPYSPENCRWANGSTQTLNRRATRLLTFNGKTQALSQWAKEIGIRRSTLSCRLKMGWPLGRAFTEPAFYRPPSPEVVKRSADQRRGKPLPPETIAKLRGRTMPPVSDATRRNISLARKGQPWTDLQRAARSGHRRSPSAATRAKMRAIMLGRKASPEAVARRVASRVANKARKQEAAI